MEGIRTVKDVKELYDGKKPVSAEEKPKDYFEKPLEETAEGEETRRAERCSLIKARGRLKGRMKNHVDQTF